MVKIIKMFKKNTLSVEIVKDNCLQKVNFRVKDKVPYRTLKYRTFATVTSVRWQLRNVVSGCAVLYDACRKLCVRTWRRWSSGTWTARRPLTRSATSWPGAPKCSRTLRYFLYAHTVHSALYFYSTRQHSFFQIYYFRYIHSTDIL